jgi:hypothetical protein
MILLHHKKLYPLAIKQNKAFCISFFTPIINLSFAQLLIARFPITEGVSRSKLAVETAEITKERV